MSKKVKKVPMVLGLDVSTSTIGWSLLPLEGFLPILGFIPLGKLKNSYEKAQKFVDVLEELNKKYDIRAVYIEEDLQKFRPGFSSAKVIQTLSRFNGMVSLMVYRTIGIIPVHLNVNAARKDIGITIDRSDKSKTTKEKVFLWVKNYLGDRVDWPTKEIRTGPRKGMTVLLDECGDMSDAFVISAAGQKNLHDS